MAVKLKSLDDVTLDPPVSRIGNAWQARQLVSSLVDDEDERQARRNKMQGLFDGNPPWTRGFLKEKGQGHRVSFNLRESEGMLDAAKTPYYDLVFEVPRFCNITFDLYDIDQELCSEWSEIVSEEFHYMLDEWKGYDREIQLSQWEMCAFGKGPMFWGHPISWQPMAIKEGRALVPYRTRAGVEYLELLVIMWRVRPGKLYDMVRDLESAKAVGWNRDLTLKEIAKAGEYGPGWVTGHASRVEKLQKAIRHGDQYYDISQAQDVLVSSIFTSNFDGGVDHFIIGRSPDSDNKEEDVDSDNPDDVEVGYMYRRRKEYEEFSQIICPFFFDTGPDGEWHGIKGLGPKIFDFCDVSNRSFCQTIDGATIGSGLVLEAGDAGAYNESQIMSIGGATVVRHGSRVVQTRIADSLQGALQVRKALTDILQTNTGTYRQPAQMEQHAPTYGQEQMYAQMRGALTKGSVSRYYNQLDPFYSEMVRRALDDRQSDKVPGGKAAIKFKENCLKRGVPEGALKWENVKCVKAVRSIGYGSPQLRDMATKELMSMTPAMDENARNYAERLRVAAIPGVGQAGANILFPSLNKKRLPEDHVWEAMQENRSLREANGAMFAPVTSKQNHKVHFMVHFTDAMHHAQQMQQGGAKAHEVLIHLDEVGPHIKQHLEKMPQLDKLAALYAGNQQNSRKQDGEHKQMEKAWHSLSQMTDKLHAEVERANDENAKAKGNGNGQAQQQPQLDPDIMVDLFKAKSEMDIKREKMRGGLALAAEKQAFTHRLKDAGMAADIHRENARFTHSLLLDR